MSTSGQHYAAQDVNASDYEAMIKKVKENDDAEEIDSHSPLGLEVADVLETAAVKLQRVRQHCLLYSAPNEAILMRGDGGGE